MVCFKCDKLTNDYEADKMTCASCREVFKIDLVKLVLGLDPIYLSEANRNKKGRKSKLTATEKHDIYWKYQRQEYSIRQLAKKYGVSVGTISKYVHTPS